ncbi:zinc finger MYM-type protein 1-like [Colias croceus]|uniref:zinc finger MYM-type protein 1-like n=1 Tax=Colias crocea TaxID=72248 RepID=UPI001E27BDFC|nr:zinc finger MYM-type protein 1-like [Colias croceus]
MKKHSESRNHLLNELELASIGRQDIRKALDSAYRESIREFNDRVDENRHILRRLIDCVLFCGAFQFALRGHDESSESLNPGIYRGLVDFVTDIDLAMKQHLTNKSVFKGTSKSIQNDILDAIYEVCICEIQQQIKKSNFVAIQADETTDCSTIQQLVFIVRYVHDGKIYERFIKYLQPKGHTADILAAEILNELDSLNIDKNKLIGQCYDGASVMSGNSNGVQKIVRDMYPYAYYVHCYAHQLNLILERGASINNTIRSFFCNLHAFPSFFTRSPKRSEFLKEIVNRRIPAAPQTRWNYNTRTMIIINDNVEPLKECMQAIMDLPNSDSNTFNQAQSLLSYLNNDDFLYWLDFFATLMPHCETLFNFLQTRYIDSTKVTNEVSRFEKTVSELSNAAPRPPTPPTKKRRPNNVSHSAMRKEICDVVRMQIKERCMYTDHLLASKLFFTDNFENYNQNFPEEDFKKVVKTYDFLENSKLKNELVVIYSREDFHNADGAIALLQYFIEFNLESVFVESIKLLKLICTIPMTSVESERCFSTLNKVKTFTRNSMTQDRLNALCMISIEKRLINQISDFHKKVIDIFAHQKNRRMHFLYK